MNVAFLFPGSNPYEALDDWVRTLGRHSRRHNVGLCRTPAECGGADCVFVLTEMNAYPRERVDADLKALGGHNFAVVHNNDSPGWGFGRMMTGVPTPGDYPSFCWTRTAMKNLASHHAELVRQPLFPPIVPPASPTTLLGTFGNIEVKKQTYSMARWAKAHGIPFCCVAPDNFAEHKKHLIAGLKDRGCDVRLHPWLPTVEELAPLVADCSHFLFVLTGTKAGTGGSATSPRYAGFFNRPVVVVDDEETFKDDGFYVYRSLNDISPADLPGMKPPCYAWGPDEYLDALCERTLAFWSR